MHDIIIRGGTIFDGSGAEGFAGDVAVKDGVIVAVGHDVAGPAKQVIDADGAIVTPAWVGSAKVSNRVKVAGRAAAALSRQIISTSDSRLECSPIVPSVPEGISCMTPAPTRRNAPAMAISSASGAKVPGTCSPPIER